MVRRWPPIAGTTQSGAAPPVAISCSSSPLSKAFCTSISCIPPHLSILLDSLFESRSQTGHVIAIKHRLFTKVVVTTSPKKDAAVLRDSLWQQGRSKGYNPFYTNYPQDMVMSHEKQTSSFFSSSIHVKVTRKNEKLKLTQRRKKSWLSFFVISASIMNCLIATAGATPREKIVWQILLFFSYW